MTILEFIGLYLLVDLVASVLVLALFVGLRRRVVIGLKVLAHRLMYPVARQAVSDELDARQNNEEESEVCDDCLGEDCICEDKNA